MQYFLSVFFETYVTTRISGNSSLTVLTRGTMCDLSHEMLSTIESHLHKRILLDGLRADIIERIAGFGDGGSPCDILCSPVSGITGSQYVICTDMFKKEMKSLAMVMMTQMTQFMKQDVVTQY